MCYLSFTEFYWLCLSDITVIAICAAVSGADGWKDMEEYGKAKYEWLKNFLELPHG
ncbi:MAG: transposase family protein, partial [bacterium]|nr:transposase family protein [bacterium]